MRKLLRGPGGSGGLPSPGVSAEGLLWDLSEICFSLAPNYLEAFWLVWTLTKKIKRWSPWRNGACVFENAAASRQDDLADSEQPDKFLIASIKGEVPRSSQPYVTDALNGELPKKLLEYLVFLRKAFWFPFHSNTEAALATNGFYIWKGRKAPNIWPMTKIFPHHLAFERSPMRHVSFKTVEVK